MSKRNIILKSKTRQRNMKKRWKHNKKEKNKNWMLKREKHNTSKEKERNMLKKKHAHNKKTSWRVFINQ